MRLGLSALVLGATLVAGCGSPGPTPPPATATPSGSPVPSSSMASGGVTPAPGASGQSHAAPDLEAMLPSQVDGTTLSKASGTGAGVFGDDAFSTSMTTFLASAGKTPADFRFAQAWDPAAALDMEVGAFQATGVDAAALRSAIVEASRPNAAGLTTSTATIANKPVTVLAYQSGSTLYLYEHQAAVLYVGTTDADLASRVLAALP